MDTLADAPALWGIPAPFAADKAPGREPSTGVSARSGVWLGPNESGRSVVSQPKFTTATELPRWMN
ncbi:MAG: hypothetical protein ACO32M_06825, partial [Ilumatobacteraceae bacterium]